MKNEIFHKNYKIIFEDFENEIEAEENNLLLFDKEYLNFKNNLKVTISIFEDENLVKKKKMIGTFITSEIFILLNHFLISENSLIIYYEKFIVCLSIPNLEIIWKIDTFFDVISLDEYKNDFIVYDELEIARINKSGNIIWKYSGIDHFISYQGNNSFQMKENYIELRDSFENIYKIDYDGKVIAEPGIPVTVKSENTFKTFIKNLFN